ncbi:MAG TPA: 50S ribosomal protein L33 [Candidatus Udaeobacter sp.]|nr:50S ribosomal protein L33 [Candidatus Udaeobacter sp.]
MSQDNMVKMECSQCHNTHYFTTKNPHIKVRLELKKHCKVTRKHAVQKQTK